MVTQQSLNIYLSIVPDKSYFLAEKHGYLSMDYEKMAAELLPQPSCLKTVPWHRDLSQVFTGHFENLHYMLSKSRFHEPEHITP